MSDFMTELAKTAEKMGESIGKGIDSAKLKWAVMRLKSDLEGCYTELGKYISDHRDNLTEDACLEHITGLYEKIDRLKADISLLQEALPKSKSICRACGKSYKKEYDFCPFCGCKKADPAEKTEKTEKTDSPAGEKASQEPAGDTAGETVRETASEPACGENPAAGSQTE